jgi:uncharacterized membrane protein YidH (DUF202 family)
MSIGSILLGLALVVAGIAFVKFTFQITNFTGRQDWIESIAGSGQTYGVYKLLGVALVLLGLLIATGFGINVLNWVFSPLRALFHYGAGD